MRDKIARLDELGGRARIIPVITIAREEDVLPLADALAAGGLRVLEITLRSEHGLHAIRQLRQARPDLQVGAGTVLDGRMLAAAEAAGAQFAVAPGSTPELLQAALASAVPLLPGVSSASDIMLGYGLGYRRFKLFPAELCGGTAALKAFSGPFADSRFCPTGGISPQNLRNYMALGNVICVGGSWMMESQWIRAGDWAQVTRASAEALSMLSSLNPEGAS